MADRPRRPAHLREPEGRRRAWPLLVLVAVLALVVGVVLVGPWREDGDGSVIGGDVDGEAAFGLDGDPVASAPPLPSLAPEDAPALPGRAVLADERRVVVQDVAGGATRPLFELPVSKPEDVEPPLIGGVALSSDGATAWFDVVKPDGSTGSIRRVAVDGGEVQEVGPGQAPAPSPDGATLALLADGDADAPATVVLRTLATGAERRIDLGAAACGVLAWAPDGRTLAADLCEQGEPTTVALVPVAERGAVRRLTPPEERTWTLPSYRPDGGLAVVDQRGTTSGVRLVDQRTGAAGALVVERADTTFTSLDFGAAGQLLVCDADANVLGAADGKAPASFAAGYFVGAW